jgi:hypothetical protein
LDDTLRDIAVVLFAFLGLHGGLHERARQAAERQVSDAFDHTGAIHAVVAPRGFFGLEINDLYEVRVEGTGIISDRIPFFIYPRTGWKGRIHHLHLDLTRFTLRSIPIRSFRADMPNATYDLGHSLYRSRLVLRSVGEGTGSVVLGPEGILAFIRKKTRFHQTLSDVLIAFHNQNIMVSGQGSFPPFGQAPFTMTGTLICRDGRYLDLDPLHTIIKLNGITAPNSLLDLINPVVDIDEDLGLKGYFSLEGVRIVGDELIITGKSTLPVAPPGTKTP